ncbi:hypothetical protein ABTA52_19630, partial [Acinetobacter baumannii]
AYGGIFAQVGSFATTEDECAEFWSRTQHLEIPECYMSSGTWFISIRVNDAPLSLTLSAEVLQYQVTPVTPTINNAPPPATSSIE